MGLRAGGLLLRQAVNGAESPDQIDRMDSDHGAAGEQIAQDSQRHAVIGIVERGH